MQTGANQPYGNEPNLPIIETVIFSFERRVPIEVARGPQGNAMLDAIYLVLSRIELDFHDNLCAHEKSIIQAPS